MATDLTREIKGYMEDYFDKYPNMSINGLSKRAQVGATTLRRILSLSLKGNPNPKTVLNLMSVLTKKKDIELIINVSPPLTKKYLHESFESYLVKDTPECQNTDPQSFYALSESLSEDGINKIKSIQKEAIEKMKAIIKCPSNSGTHQFFTIQLGGVRPSRD
tara:strand:- start:187 stop:672 length:486 start_codon:yes stop_codon:yes gene_type:complete